MSLFFAILILLASTIVIAEIIPDYGRDEWKHSLDNYGDFLNTRYEPLLGESPTAVMFAEGGICRVAAGLGSGPNLGKLFTNGRGVDFTPELAGGCGYSSYTYRGTQCFG